MAFYLLAAIQSWTLTLHCV